MFIRATAKLLKLISPRTIDEAEPADDDWYANLIWIDGRKCLLLVHAGTLFAVFVPDVRKPDLVNLGALASQAITAALADAALPANQLGHLDPTSTQIGRTASRQLLGFMTDMAFMCEHLANGEGGLERLDVSRLHDLLHGTPYNRGGYDRPVDLARGWGDRQRG